MKIKYSYCLNEDGDLVHISSVTRGGDRTAKKNAVIQKLKGFYDKFADLTGGVFFFFFDKE